MEKILVVRSWPQYIPEKHAHVVDDFQRVIVKDFDYGNLTGLNRDVIHLDWDTAVSPEDLKLFAEYANKDRDRVIVAPQLLYPGSLNGTSVRGGYAPLWNVYGWMEHPPYRLGFLPGDPECLGFGFGMVYLPDKWLQKYPNAYMDDQAFCEWYYRQNGPTPIIWDVHPVHVNYPAMKEI